MAARKQTKRNSTGNAAAKRNGPPVLRLGKVGKIKLTDIRKAVREVRKRNALAGI